MLEDDQPITLEKLRDGKILVLGTLAKIIALILPIIVLPLVILVLILMLTNLTATTSSHSSASRYNVTGTRTETSSAPNPIDLWTTRCERCPAALDKLNEMAKTYKENGQIVFASVNADDRDFAMEIVEEK